ncbi:hypothetical protein CRUP_025432 [Coryphaenoides rupestris]|nr:hypothetical protein CRUP_025432 [Coryphaenoides rupestris]
MFMRGRPITMFFPAEVENYEDVRTELPSERLKLAYGYRGRDCRANVYLLPTGEVVYFIASVVVLFNSEERTQRHYLGHTDCVKCLAVHPDKIRIATGQIAGVDKDGRALQPHVRVWDSVSLSTLQIIGLGTFERGVGSLAFSKATSVIQTQGADSGTLAVPGSLAQLEEDVPNVWVGRIFSGVLKWSPPPGENTALRGPSGSPWKRNSKDLMSALWNATDRSTQSRTTTTFLGLVVNRVPGLVLATYRPPSLRATVQKPCSSSASTWPLLEAPCRATPSTQRSRSPRSTSQVHLGPQDEPAALAEALGVVRGVAPVAMLNHTGEVIRDREAEVVELLKLLFDLILRLRRLELHTKEQELVLLWLRTELVVLVVPGGLADQAEQLLVLTTVQQQLLPMESALILLLLFSSSSSSSSSPSFLLSPGLHDLLQHQMVSTQLLQKLWLQPSTRGSVYSGQSWWSLWFLEVWQTRQSSSWSSQLLPMESALILLLLFSSSSSSSSSPSFLLSPGLHDLLQHQMVSTQLLQKLWLQPSTRGSVYRLPGTARVPESAPEEHAQTQDTSQ